MSDLLSSKIDLANHVRVYTGRLFYDGSYTDEQRWVKAEFFEALRSRGACETSAEPFQARVVTWAQKCFWRPDALATPQRSFRFTEEAIELAQAAGTSREDVLRLVEYVYSRPIGNLAQEIGGTMVTLAALASSVGADLNECAESELCRCIANTERIREKDMNKPARSPLPGPAVETTREPPYRVRAFWSPEKRHLVTVCCSMEDITLVDDNANIWEPTGPEEDVADPKNFQKEPLHKQWCAFLAPDAYKRMECNCGAVKASAPHSFDANGSDV